ncbi:MAG: hypothetical protein WCA39_12035 [Nitrososphaeraceae archaeon]
MNNKKELKLKLIERRRTFDKERLDRTIFDRQKLESILEISELPEYEISRTCKESKDS